MEKSFSFLEFPGHFFEVVKDDVDTIKLKKNQPLYLEGSTPLGIYYLREGEVVVSKLASQGKEQVLKVVSREGFLCCSDLLLNQKYTSSSRATMNSTLLFIPKTKFLELISEDRKLNHQFMLQLAAEINALEHQLVKVAYTPLRGRLAENLLQLSQSCEPVHENGIALSRSDLASLTGTVPATVNRLLSEFQRENLIRISDKHIRILDKTRLYKTSQMYE